ncbi:uncharacterized protein LOC111452187 [Cucurbita moschata]|uniref:Uncharacterized protein LOC111452187 n=1 Tax=Cucurbita moschata TaxID=3662 RepID=A0A6J1G9H1_CUCMO|nr:uncharacterized protein LOC111452187 [Cucurbita moschata]
MASFTWLYIGLGLALGFLFLGIVAELYYLLWRNNKRINTTGVQHDAYNKPRPLPLIPSETNSTREITRNPLENRHGLDLEFGSGEDLLLKTAAEDDEHDEAEEEDVELMAIYNLAGQPRFLFTIKEETREDLESEDAKSRGDRSRKGSRNRSLSDIITAIETPFFTPIASPPLKASPLCSLDSYKLHEFNPLFESSSELEQNLNRMRSSPPPKFKFLRDAEEKLYRRLMEEAQKRGEILNTKNEQRKPSSSSQVLPLVSSPPEFRTLPNHKITPFS